MSRHNDVRPILGISQIFGELMGYIRADRIAMKHFDRWWIRLSVQTLQPLFSRSGAWWVVARERCCPS